MHRCDRLWLRLPPQACKVAHAQTMQFAARGPRPGTGVLESGQCASPKHGGTDYRPVPTLACFLVSYRPLASQIRAPRPPVTYPVDFPRQKPPLHRVGAFSNYTVFLRAFAASLLAESRYNQSTKTKKIPLMTIDAVCRNR